jgi:hypothetical protein
MFDNMLTYPLKTNEVIDAISDEYIKVFKSQDAFKRINFSDSNLQSDFSDYSDSLELNEFFQNDGFKAMMSAPSSILIVDLPVTQHTQRPEPYFYLLDIEQLIDIDFDSKGNIEYIIFSDSGNIAVFDDKFYRIYQKIKDEFILLSEEPHYLNYCPARNIWSDSVNKKNKLNKQSPITGILSRLDWLLFFETAKQNLDVYGAYPLYWTLATQCNYQDDAGNYCDGGLIKFYNEATEKEAFTKCPKCEANSIVGPGSLIEKPIPKGENKTEGGAPMGIVSIDKTSLDYNVSETERLKAEIVQSATGKLKLISKEAINSDQVQSQFENQTNVLNWIARNFEHAEEWLIDTICLMRYGTKYLGCEINWGTRFYLESIEDTINDYAQSKTSGLPSYMLIDKLIAIEETQSRGNNAARERLHLLRNLEPYPEMSIKECKEAGILDIDKQGFVLKINFANFVSRFEAKYGNIAEFGTLLDFDTRIERVKSIFNEYAKSLTQSEMVTK